MADASKLKRLGSPPPLEEARTDLAPEALPAPPTRQAAIKQPPEPEAEDYQRIDGRTLRKTGRTIPFSTRVRPDADIRIRRIAAKYDIYISEVLEFGALLLERELKQSENYRMYISELRQRAQGK